MEWHRCSDEVARCTWLGKSDTDDNHDSHVNNSNSDRKYLHSNHYLPGILLSTLYKLSFLS